MHLHCIRKHSIIVFGEFTLLLLVQCSRGCEGYSRNTFISCKLSMDFVFHHFNCLYTCMYYCDPYWFPNKHTYNLELHAETCPAKHIPYHRDPEAICFPDLLYVHCTMHKRTWSFSETTWITVWEARIAMNAGFKFIRAQFLSKVLCGAAVKATVLHMSCVIMCGFDAQFLHFLFVSILIR